jgi:vacuolar-type H+-ATPase subunit D/Vma8
MMKNIHAYFKSENDAEAAKAKLEALRAADLFVDPFPQKENEGVFVPLFTMGTTTASTGIIAEGIYMDRKEDHVTHMLQGKVDETEYEKAIKILQDENGLKKLE